MNVWSNCTALHPRICPRSPKPVRPRREGGPSRSSWKLSPAVRFSCCRDLLRRRFLINKVPCAADDGRQPQLQAFACRVGEGQGRLLADTVLRAVNFRMIAAGSQPPFASAIRGKVHAQKGGGRVDVLPVIIGPPEHAGIHRHGARRIRGELVVEPHAEVGVDEALGHVDIGVGIVGDRGFAVDIGLNLF